MPRLDPVQGQALGYWWSLIVDAVAAGFTTTETTQLVNQWARDNGGTISFQANTAISQLYGYARREFNASNAFQAADPGATITPDMISTPPWARGEQEQSSYPVYYVKFQYTYLDANGEQQTAVRTSVQPLTLADTVQGVTDDVTTDAEAFAAKYGHQLLSAVPFSILAV